MIRPPHPLLAGLWRDAGAVTGAMQALRRGEPALAALAADPLAPLADLTPVAWAFELPAGEAAIALSLTRLRAAAAAPVARRADPLEPPYAGFGSSLGAAPTSAVGTLNAARSASSRNRRDTGSEPASGVSAPAQDAASALAEATRLGARWRVVGGSATPDTRQAIDLILGGLRPSTAALLAAVDVAADEPPVPAAPSANVEIAGAVAAALARVDAARGAAARLAATRTPLDPSMPGDSPQPPPTVSGFRRLAARFVQPPVAPAAATADTFSGTHGPSPDFATRPPTDAAAPRHPAVLPQVQELVPDSPFSVPRRAGEDIAGEAEMAELLARVLRREARRQGIADESGAA